MPLPVSVESITEGCRVWRNAEIIPHVIISVVILSIEYSQITEAKIVVIGETGFEIPFFLSEIFILRKSIRILYFLIIRASHVCSAKSTKKLSSKMD